MYEEIITCLVNANLIDVRVFNHKGFQYHWHHPGSK